MAKEKIEDKQEPCAPVAVIAEFPADLREVYKRLGKVWEARHS